MAEDGGSAGEQVEAAAVDVDPSHPVKAYLGLALAQLNEFYTQYNRQEAEKQNCRPNTGTEIHLQGNQVINFRSSMLTGDARCWIAQRPNSHDNYLDYTVRLPESFGKMIERFYMNAGGSVWIDLNEYWLIRCIMELTLGEGEWTKQALDEGCQIAAPDCQYEHGSKDRQGRNLTKSQIALPASTRGWGAPQHSFGEAAFTIGETQESAYRKRFGFYNQENVNSPDVPDPTYTETLNFKNGNQKTKLDLPINYKRRWGDYAGVPFVDNTTEEDTCLMPAYADGTRYPWEMASESLYQQGCEGYPRPGFSSVKVGYDSHQARTPPYEQYESTFKICNLYGVFSQMYPAVADLSMLNQVTVGVEFRSGHCCPVSRVRDSVQLRMAATNDLQKDPAVIPRTPVGTDLLTVNTNTLTDTPEAELQSKSGTNEETSLGDFYIPNRSGVGPYATEDDVDYSDQRTMVYAFGNDNLFCDPGPLHDTEYVMSDRPIWNFSSDYDRVPAKESYRKNKEREYPPTPTFEVFNIALIYETIAMDSPLYTKQIENLQQQGALEYQFRNYYVHGNQHNRSSTTQHHTQCLTRMYAVMQPMDHDIAAPPVQMKDNPGDKTTNNIPPTMARSHRFSTMNIDSWQMEVNQSKFPDFRVKPSDTWHLFFDGTATNTSLVRNIRDFLDYKFVMCTRFCFPHGNDRSLDGLDIRGVNPQLRVYTYMNGREFMEPVDPSGISPDRINAMNLSPAVGQRYIRLTSSLNRNPQDQLWRYGEFYAADPETTKIEPGGDYWTLEYSATQFDNKDYQNYNSQANNENHLPLSAMQNGYPDYAAIMKGKFVKPVTYPTGVYMRMMLESKSTLRIGSGRQNTTIP